MMKSKVFLKLGVLYLISILTAMLFARIRWENLSVTAYEISLHFLLLFILVMFKPVRVYIENLPPLYNSILIVFILLMSVAQTVNSSAATFPFASWDMYTKSEGDKDISFYKYVGVTDEGLRVELDIKSLYPSFPHGGFGIGLDKKVSLVLRNQKNTQLINNESQCHSNKFVCLLKRSTNRIRGALNTSDQYVTYNEEDLRALLIAILNKYNRNSKEASLEVVEVYKVKAKLIRNHSLEMQPERIYEFSKRESE